MNDNRSNEIPFLLAVRGDLLNFIDIHKSPSSNGANQESDRTIYIMGILPNCLCISIVYPDTPHFYLKNKKGYRHFNTVNCKMYFKCTHSNVEEANLICMSQQR